MLKRCVLMIGVASVLTGCALEPLRYQQAAQATASSTPPLQTICVKTDYWDGCKRMRVERLRTDPQWRMLLGGDGL
jgi:hypothetical protein